MTLESLGVEPTGDLEMVEAIRQEVRRLCKRDAIVAHILQEDQAAEYTSDYKRLFTTDAEQVPTSRIASQATKMGSRVVSRATSESSRGWDPILAGYHARERMSRAPTPGDLVMRRSLLPMDLNSTSSENSDGANMDKWDDLSEHSEDEEESGSELDDHGLEQMGEKHDSSVTDGTSNRSTSPTKVEFSEDHGVPLKLPTEEGEGNSDQDSNSGFELESNNDDAELLKLADEISERNISSPGPLHIGRSHPNEGNLGPTVASSRHTGS